jgi:hypothetical protein
MVEKNSQTDITEQLRGLAELVEKTRPLVDLIVAGSLRRQNINATQGEPEAGGYMTIAHAAEHFDMSPKQIGRWCDEGELEGVKLDTRPNVKRTHVTMASVRRKERRLRKPR